MIYPAIFRSYVKLAEGISYVPMWFCKWCIYIYVYMDVYMSYVYIYIGINNLQKKTASKGLSQITVQERGGLYFFWKKWQFILGKKTKV